MHDHQPENEQVSTSDLIQQRRTKLEEWRKSGGAYPTDFRRNALAQDLMTQHENKEEAELEANPIEVKVAGRIMTRRLMGKASFTHIQDMSGRIQLYIRQDEVTPEVYEAFKQWDLGDIIGAEGHLFKTKTGELSVKVKKIVLLTKAIRPLPDKFHGLTDQETRYRQRYLDLIANEEARRTFLMRSNITDSIRQFLKEQHFLEVETPMMQVLAGGAAAKPFVTYHHALDMPLFLRIAPELYLKRLVVGGFERVFEINRNFRNEGLSTQHNPEFTMLEFYQAYADYNDLMDLTENMFRKIARDVLGQMQFSYQGTALDFSKPFTRLTLKEAILAYNSDLKAADIETLERAKETAKKLGIPTQESYGLGKIQVEIFEKTVEQKLKQPTFITQYPAEVSPLARRNDQDPFVTDRFELFIAGREIANGFTELNDPEDQAERFHKQMRDKAEGDEEAMPYDEDYIVALEHGLPPTAGEGIGIDRLVMLFTDSPSIRDVILFPHMRPKE
ncbi:lysine--tRNA ligase [Aquicella lusitana]|uniref:Lysine--tRNA ligase n=1 Tax=Aquicella lusitana TaxID=254246 RepID=A0A370G8U0_9COXI|nr:lysine--tRNA ligase [Aquicella lusitana]RDI38443.1 lysyl-tRNA synthetase class II [Aquicella lusitana]VVC73752.1 Lysine--tRNA ligase [Aquicella lusitana]